MKKSIMLGLFIALSLIFGQGVMDSAQAGYVVSRPVTEWMTGRWIAQSGPEMDVRILSDLAFVEIPNSGRSGSDNIVWNEELRAYELAAWYDGSMYNPGTKMLYGYLRTPDGTQARTDTLELEYNTSFRQDDDTWKPCVIRTTLKKENPHVAPMPVEIFDKVVGIWKAKSGTPIRIDYRYDEFRCKLYNDSIDFQTNLSLPKWDPEKSEVVQLGNGDDNYGIFFTGQLSEDGKTLTVKGTYYSPYVDKKVLHIESVLVKGR